MKAFLAQGGAGMVPTLLFGFWVVASAVMFLLRPSRVRLPGILCAGVLALTAGALGTVMGWIATFRYLDAVPAEQQVKVAAAGMQESLHCAVAALVLILIAALVTQGGLARLARAPQAVLEAGM